MYKFDFSPLYTFVYHIRTKYPQIGNIYFIFKHTILQMAILITFGGKLNFVKRKKTCQSKRIQVIGQRFYGRGPPIPNSAATLILMYLQFRL